MVALPAVWLANRDDAASPRPNVAAAGAAVADGAAASVPPVSIDPMGTVDAQYLDGAVPAPPATAGPITPVIGTAEGHVVATATAVFRRSVTSNGTCLYNGVTVGSRITVVNVDNDRSITCTTALRPMDQPQARARDERRRVRIDRRSQRGADRGRDPPVRRPPRPMTHSRPRCATS